MKLEIVDSQVVAEPRALRLVVRRRVATSPGHREITSRRLMGLALLRIAFGVIWAVDASLKWQPAFQANFQKILSGVAQGQPGFLSWWFGMWQFVVSGRAPVFGILTASTETYLALALIAGFARKFTYSLGILYGLFVWSVAEGFGGPYTPGTTTDVGAAIIYSLLFLALLLVDAGRLSVDHLIVKKVPAWRWISEFGGAGR
jgi:nitrite reductase (NO-forming)